MDDAISQIDEVFIWFVNNKKGLKVNGRENKMEKIIIQKVNIRGYMRDSKMKAAQQRINEYIQDNNLDVICASLFNGK